MGPLPGRATLQGWAIVENQTDNDWEGVRLSLVSGRPISFVQDLYRPLYIPRPVALPESYASLEPQTYEGGMASPKEAQTLAVRGSPGSIRGIGVDPATQPNDGVFARTNTNGNDSFLLPADDDGGRLDPGRSVSSAASANKLGELFEYAIREPLTLARQKSAMIPIVEDAVEIERVSIYDEAVLRRYPLNGARVKNTTGKHLLAGPVTVLDAGSYAGDARMDDVPPGQERLVSFGIDLQMPVAAANNRVDASFLTGKIVKGVLQLTYKDVRTQEYQAENKGDRDKQLVVIHPARPGWKLLEPKEPSEKTDAVYRFKGTVPAGKLMKLTVKEENVRRQDFEILPGDATQVVAFSNTDGIPPKVKDALAKAAELKSAVVETHRRVEDGRGHVNGLVADQRRIDETLKTIGPNTELYGRLMKKLGDDETQIDQTHAEVEALVKQEQVQQKEMEDYVQRLNVD